jgi:hypothetical protein
VKHFLPILLLLLSLNSYAKQLGVGISLGNPTGFNGKYWLNKSEAVDGGLAYSFGKNANMSLHSDYLFHKFGAFYLNDIHPLDLYYGVGARMEFASDIELGVRVPVGLAHSFKEPADMFVEIAPIVDIFSKTGLEIHLLFGARFYF